MAHREGIREYLKDVQVHGLVIDWGCGTKPIKNYLKPNEARFIGIDKLDYVGADRIKDFEYPLDLGYRADFAFCLEVLEHCYNFQVVLENIFKHLENSGILYLSTPFLYQTHKEDDYQRWTHHGLRKLIDDNGFYVEDIQPTEGNLDNASGYIVKAVK